MTGLDTARNETLMRLAASRADIRRILEPPPRVTSDDPEEAGSGAEAFPRSRTMKMLLSARGAGTVGAVACGLLVARPRLALRLIRMVPAAAIGRILLTRAFLALRSHSAVRAKRERRPSPISPL
ncbi:MAG TPA: hypothetical protein VKP66_06945 [Steroidobacteraceae bacterium]|nr:hypothetical protein [Steroidobacteraceae bacterium]